MEITGILLPDRVEIDDRGRVTLVNAVIDWMTYPTEEGLVRDLVLITRGPRTEPYELTIDVNGQSETFELDPDPFSAGQRNGFIAVSLSEQFLCQSKGMHVLTVGSLTLEYEVR